MSTAAPDHMTEETATGAPVTAATSYKIAGAASRFMVQAFAEGLLSAFGHNPRFNANEISGTVTVPGDDLNNATVEILVRADSLRLVDDVSENDRQEIYRTMHEHVLETARYPEIRFKGKTVAADRIYEGFFRVKLAGLLLLHGVSREHSLEAQVRLLESGLRAEGETQLRQSNYGVKRVSVAAGTLKVKDEVKVSFSIEAKA